MKRNQPTNIRTARGKGLRGRNQSLPYREITAPRYSDGSCPKLRLSLHLPTMYTHPSSHFSLSPGREDKRRMRLLTSEDALQ